MHDIFETSCKETISQSHLSILHQRQIYAFYNIIFRAVFFILRCVKVFLTSIWDKLYLAVTLYFRLEPHHAFYKNVHETNARILLCLSIYISSFSRIRILSAQIRQER